MNFIFNIATGSNILLLGVIVICSACTQFDNRSDYHTWQVYLGDKSSTQYSAFDQINLKNVDQLNVAWIYHTEDADTSKNSQIQTNPIIIEDIIYGVSPRMKLFSLNAVTGQERWVFNPLSDTAQINQGVNNIRGVSWWAEKDDQRIIYAAGSRLYAVDANTGDLVASFGDDGSISLKRGLKNRSKNLYVSATSPGIIYQDLIIIGSRVSEGNKAAPGDIRAFNVRTGELEWVFHTIPHPGEAGYETWDDPEAWKNIGGANSWAGMSLDDERGMVFIPTGSASPDFYGGNRKGANLFANTLLALDALTGELIWHYQTIHHDLWDRDLPSPPSLITVTHNGKRIDAVAQATKTGFIFLFNRETGEPLFPIEERPVPTDSELIGEEVWPTQPNPTKPEPFTSQQMREDDLNPYVSDEVRKNLRERLDELDSDHMFAPPSLNGMLMYPGYDGGAEWGGSAFDPETGLLYVNSNEVPRIMTMVPSEQTRPESKSKLPTIGRSLYTTHCMSCHGSDLRGSGNNPSILNLKQQYSASQLLSLIENGRNMMPGFNYLSDKEKKTIINYLMNENIYAVGNKSEVTNNDKSSAPYIMTGYNRFRTPDGYPASSPPWGTLNAINMNTGEYAWRIPLGEYQELKEKGIPTTGTENYGGPVVTAGGVVFIAATFDSKLRAFNKQTGELLWETLLPAAGFATPSTYQVDGKQYLVIACGGGKQGIKSGDAYVAFSLPDKGFH